MATNAKANANRPGRTLAILALVIGLLAALVAVGGEWSPRLGLDLQGGTRITLQAQANDGEDITDEKLDQAQEIIASRVNGTGVAAAEVSTRGGNSIIVEIPGERRGDIVDQVGRTAQLRFRLVWLGPASGQPLPDAPADDSVGPNGGSQNGGQSEGGQNEGGQNQGGPNGDRKNRVASGWMLSSDDTGAGQQPDSPAEQNPATDTDTPLSKMTTAENIATTLTSNPPPQYTDEFQQAVQRFNRYACPAPGETAKEVQDRPGEALVTCDDSGQKYLLSPAVIEGTSLTDATAVLPQQTPQWAVSLELDDTGTDVFSEITQRLVATGKLFAIVLDGQVLSAPTVNNPITNGQAEISGGFTQDSATELANQLQYGALPLSFTVAGVTLNGPTLAGSQLSAGVLAGIIGLALVVVYCMLYYRGLGIVVVASLLVAGVLTYEVVILLGTSVGFTLTLPGIAGLIVAVGITADSFIIFFERLRDEVRDGRSLRLAVEAGWKRARTTILAADAVSLLAAVVLYTFAIDEIRGFAFALGVTTVIDVLVVFFFTKPLVTLLAKTRFFGQGHKLSGFDPGHLGITGRSVSQLATTARRPQEVAR